MRVGWYSSNYLRILLLLLLLLVLLLIDIRWGGQPLSAPIWQSSLFWQLRLPRVLTAAWAGALLSLAGLLLQTLFRNPLADPSILGVSAGAGLGVAVLIFFSSQLSWSGLAVYASSWTLLAAVLGAASVLLLLLLLSWWLQDVNTLLLVGVMLGYLNTAIISIGQYLSQPEQLQTFLLWTLGSFEATLSEQLPWLVLSTIAMGFLVWLSSGRLNIWLLGETYTESMGVKPAWVKAWIIFSSALATALVVAFCGPIAFVGIAVPHLARMYLRTQNHRYTIPACMLLGGVFCLLCDIISHALHTYYSLPVNVITALLGAPVVVSVFIRYRAHLQH